jgi:hypothetical protein
LNLIDLYFLIELEEDVRNALITWSQKVGQERKLKIVLMTLPNWLCEQDGWQNVRKSLRRLGEAIVSFVKVFDSVYQVRIKDQLRCELGSVTFPEQPFDEDMLLVFREQFKAIMDGTPNCHLCRFKARQQSALDRRHIDLFSTDQRQTHRQNTGYVTQAERLEKAALTKDTVPKCSWCERLGDSIIALMASRDAGLVTADRAFEAFGAILGIAVVLLPSLAQLRREALTQ